MDDIEELNQDCYEYSVALKLMAIWVEEVYGHDAVELQLRFLEKASEKWEVLRNGS